MDINQLQSNVERLKRELQETRDLLESAIDPEAVSADLARTRAYAFDSEKNAR